MNENLTNEVVEEVIETTMAKNSKAEMLGGLGIGMLLGAAAIKFGPKLIKKIRESKEIIVEKVTDDEEPEEEENSEEE